MPKNVPMHVRSDPHSIGFCRSSLVFSGIEKVKAIAISRTNDSSPVELTKESMLDGSYPITRPLGLCYNQANSKAGLTDFIEFCRLKAKETKLVCSLIRVKMTAHS